MILEPIHYIHLNHSANNTTILPQFWITVVFNFSWEYCNTQEKFETIVMQNFWGWTRCIMVYVKIVNGEKRSSWEKNVFKFVTQAARKKNSESQQQESNLCSTSFLSRHIWTSHRFDSVGGNFWIFSSELCRFLKIILLHQQKCQSHLICNMIRSKRSNSCFVNGDI